MLRLHRKRAAYRQRARDPSATDEVVDPPPARGLADEDAHPGKPLDETGRRQTEDAPGLALVRDRGGRERADLRDPAELWRLYVQLTEVEAAFKNLKDDLGLRPIYHQLEHRIEAHIFIAFMSYCLHVTLRAKLKPLAPGLTARAVLDKFAAIQMLDVQFPTTDGRTLILTRYTEPNADQTMLLNQLKLTLPAQPPPRITAAGALVR